MLAHAHDSTQIKVFHYRKRSLAVWTAVDECFLTLSVPSLNDAQETNNDCSYEKIGKFL